MKVVFEPKRLKAALAPIIAVVGRNPSKVKPILRHCRIKAAGDRAELFATNFEAQVCVEVACGVQQDGVALVEIDRLDRIASIAAGEIVVEVDGNASKICSGRSSWKIGTESTQDYPPSNQDAPAVAFDAPRPFIDIFSKAAVAADVGSTRYALDGVHIGGPELIVAATDGLRVFFHDAKRVVEKMSSGVTIPTRYVAAIGRIFGESESVAIGVRENWVSFEADGVRIQVPVLEGRYPRVREIFLRDKHTTVSCKTEALAEAMRSVSLSAGGLDLKDEEGGYKVVGLSTSKGVLSVRARQVKTSDESESEIECQSDAKDGERLAFVQLHLLSEAVRIHGEEIEIGFYKEGRREQLQIHAPLWSWAMVPMTKD